MLEGLVLCLIGLLLLLRWLLEGHKVLLVDAISSVAALDFRLEPVLDAFVAVRKVRT